MDFTKGLVAEQAKEAALQKVYDRDWRYIEMADLVGTWSKDRSRKVGCVVVGPNKEVRSTGYNGFPRRVSDVIEERHKRPAKYMWTEHAERNAIYNAARVGIPLEGCTIYMAWFPCIDCARAIVQSGITTLVSASQPDLNDPKYGEEFRTGLQLLKEAGIAYRLYTREGPTQKTL
jgi:dCMP deaminase